MWCKTNSSKNRLIWIMILLRKSSLVDHIHGFQRKDRSNQTKLEGNLPAANFRWEASVDAVTGLASSSETSFVHVPKSSSQKVSPRTIRKISQDFVSCWPSFVSHVMFGLVRTVRTPPPPNHSSLFGRQTSAISAIQPPMWLPFRATLLEFGDSIPCRNKEQSHTKNIRGDRLIGCWEIPLKGGRLATRKDDPVAYGKLRLSIATARYGWNETYHKFDCYRISTRIIDYSPCLVGCNVPVPWIRRCLYLHTQSYVHAYTTWRFHKEWHHALQQAIIDSATS